MVIEGQDDERRRLRPNRAPPGRGWPSMIVGIIFAVLMGLALWGALGAAGVLGDKTPFARIIMGGYLLRLLIQFFIRDVQLFSHAAGGDALLYEEYARMIAQVWAKAGLHYVTSTELKIIGPTSLPANLFAFATWLNGGETTRLACTAMVALAAGLTALNLYTLAVQFGAERKSALLFSTILYLQPSFLFYTSDSYKDALVVCFTLGALASALRLGFRFSWLHAALGAVCICALWYVRFYLIFVTVAPLFVGLVGVGSKRLRRPALAAFVLGTAAVLLAAFTDILQLASQRASETFEIATSENVLLANSVAGSGVVFDDGGSPYGALPAKLAYTLFSPFPWAGGSLGFQLGKIDAVLWYVMVYRAIRGARQAPRRLTIMLATFVLPCTLMYAMSMANVGLIVRQRLVIVAGIAILAAVYKPGKASRTADVRSPVAARASTRKGTAV